MLSTKHDYQCYQKKAINFIYWRQMSLLSTENNYQCYLYIYTDDRLIDMYAFYLRYGSCQGYLLKMQVDDIYWKQLSMLLTEDSCHPYLLNNLQ